jgi:hypothetical protein
MLRSVLTTLSFAIALGAACQPSSSSNGPLFDGGSATLDGGGSADGATAPDAGKDSDITESGGPIGSPKDAESEGSPTCGVKRTYDIVYSDTVQKISADSAKIYDPNLFKDGVLDTSCQTPTTFNHVIGYGTVEITGCVDACGAYITSDATIATVVYAENSCTVGFTTPPESYNVPANAAVYNPPCDK